MNLDLLLAEVYSPNIKQGGVVTSWINVITDYQGNLITTYPVAP